MAGNGGVVDRSPLLQVAELAQWPEPGELTILDVSVALESPRFDGDYRVGTGARQWTRAHIPGSIHVDLLTTLCEPDSAGHHTRPGTDRLAADLARLGIDPHSTIVLYDQSSMMWAARVWWVLRNAGISSFVLDGGLEAWTAHELPLESGPPTALPARDSRPDLPDLGLWIDKDEVNAISRGQATGTLVCALSAGHFTAKIPTRYARRGHIPGSVNLSAREVLDADGRLHDSHAIRALADSAAVTADGPLALYCGGGISACLLALGLTVAGFDQIRVYDGSLEEWSADPALPLLTTPTATSPR